MLSTPPLRLDLLQLLYESVACICELKMKVAQIAVRVLRCLPRDIFFVHQLYSHDATAASRCDICPDVTLLPDKPLSGEVVSVLSDLDDAAALGNAVSEA